MADFKTSSIVRIESLQSWEEALQETRGYGSCGLEIETIGSDPLISGIRLVLLALPNHRIYVANILDLGTEILAGLAVLLEDSQVKKIIHNAKFALSFIRISQGRRLKFGNIFDTKLASQICWAGYYYLVPSKSPKNPWKKRDPDHSLKALAERHLGIALDNSCQDYDWGSRQLAAEQIGYAAMNAKVLLLLEPIFADLIAKNGLERIAELEFRTILPVVEMELSGVCLDSGATKALISEKEGQLVKAVIDLQSEAKENGFIPLPGNDNKPIYYLNPDSQEDVKRYLRSQGFQITTTKGEILKEVAASGNIFADRLLSYRRLSHQLAFLNSWLQRIHPVDGRIHPQYFQLNSATGRISSRKPNAQQVPARGEDSQAIRKLFKAPSGKKLVKADFSAIEMRIMAYLSGDGTMLKAFHERQDLHNLTASRISGQPLDQATKTQRQAGKCINYLLIYGGSAETLQLHALYDYGLVMSLVEAEEARERYFETYAGIKEWQLEQIKAMNYTHDHYFHDCVRGAFSLPLTCTLTRLGRRRVWSRFGVGIKASKFQAFNTPCQGTGADLIKTVMCELYNSLRSEDVKIIGSIHDEILLEVPEDQAEAYAGMLIEIMDRVGSELLYPVPVISEAKILSSWGG